MDSLFIRGSVVVLIFWIFISPSYGQESLFPEISGWTLTQDDSIYDSTNLWDIIDGAADLYLEYAFVNLHIARYISVDGIDVKIELYHHGSEADAFGIYSQERNPDYHFISIGVQGYLQQGVLNFLDGRYYVKMSTYQTGDAAQEALLALAKKIEEYLKQNNSWPHVLRFFPMAGKLDNTEQYVSQNFLGYSFLNSAYVAAYKDGTLFKIFIIEAETAERAGAMMAEYCKVIPKEAVVKLDDGKYEIRDAHHGLLAVTVQDRFLYGVINFQSEQTRDMYLQRISDNLSKQK